MSTYRELIKIVADLAKQVSDDDTLTDRHIAFLLNKFRTYLIKQKYGNSPLSIPDSNYQTICVKLSSVDSTKLANCCTDNKCSNKPSFYSLISDGDIPKTMDYGNPKTTLIRCAGKFTISVDAYNSIGQTSNDDEEFCDYLNELLGQEALQIYDNIPKTLEDYYLTTCMDDVQTIIDMVYARFPKYYDLSVHQVEQESEQECNPDVLYYMTSNAFGNVQMVDKERFPYVGLKKHSSNFVYGTIGASNKLHIKSVKDISLYNKAFITSIFENPDEAYEQSSCIYKDEETGKVTKCPSGDANCDPWDNTFPIEDALQTQLISLALREIVVSAYRPKDNINDAADNLANIETFVRNNMKQQYVRQQQPSDGTAE